MILNQIRNTQQLQLVVKHAMGFQWLTWTAVTEWKLNTNIFTRINIKKQKTASSIGNRVGVPNSVF